MRMCQRHTKIYIYICVCWFEPNSLPNLSIVVTIDSSITTFSGYICSLGSNSENFSRISTKMSTKMSTPEPVGLASMPPEVMLEIISYLPRRRDWLSLARSCQHVSSIVTAELTKYSLTVTGDRSYSCWYACVHANLDLLRRHLAHDPNVVHYLFPRETFQSMTGHRDSGDGFRLVRSSNKWKPDGNEMTPLAIAVIAGNYTVVQELLAKGANPNRTGAEPSSTGLLRYPIHWAVCSRKSNSIAIIKALGKYSANLNTEHRDLDIGMGIGQMWRGESCAPIFLLLMLQKPRARTQGQTTCEMFNHDFQQLQKFRLQQLTALLKSGADPNIKYPETDMTPVLFLLSSLNEYSPSFYFSSILQTREEEREQSEIVSDTVISFLETLHSFGSDLNKSGDTFTYRSSPTTYMYRVPEEFDRNIFLRGRTPLLMACRLHDDYKKFLIPWFIVNGARTDMLTAEGTTMLMEFCQSRFADISLFKKILTIRDHPHINFTGPQGRTAFHYLCANPRITPRVKVQAIKLMFSIWADPTLVSEEGHTPCGEIEKTKSDAFMFDESVELLKKYDEKWKTHLRGCMTCRCGSTCGGGGQLRGPHPDGDYRPGPSSSSRPGPSRGGSSRRGSSTTSRGSSTPQTSSNRGSSHQSPFHRGSTTTDRGSLASNNNRGAPSQGPSHRGAPSQRSSDQGPSRRGYPSRNRYLHHLGGLDRNRVPASFFEDHPAPQGPPSSRGSHTPGQFAQGPPDRGSSVRGSSTSTRASPAQVSSNRGAQQNQGSSSTRGSSAQDSSSALEGNNNRSAAARGGHQSTPNGPRGNGRGNGRGYGRGYGRGGRGGRGGQGGRVEN